MTSSPQPILPSEQIKSPPAHAHPPHNLQYSIDAPPDGDDQSSSLSEIGDRAGNDDPDSTRISHVDGSDANDTEAETERLEDSPQNERKRRNVVLTASNQALGNGASPLLDYRPTVKDANTEVNRAILEPLSDISSLVDSGEENEGANSPVKTNGRKRKRSSFDNNHEASRESSQDQTLANATDAVPVQNFPPAVMTEKANPREESSIDNDKTTLGEDSDLLTNGREIHVQDLLSGKQKPKKGKRKSKKIRDEAIDPSNNAIQGEDPQLSPAEVLGGHYSNGEDEEIDEAGDEIDNELATRNEEGQARKKSAMELLSKIENCFATLRDKLFDEKLMQYNEELAMLEQINPTHPDYLALMKVINKHRDDKIQREKTTLKFKLQALQRKSIAEKAQVHAQYMQTVREIREKALEYLQNESYQIQRERRNVEGDGPSYSYSFPTRRSQQIIDQTAYNLEVSILSGIAKHVGFPAAPEISGAKPSEIEDDFNAMGITHLAPRLRSRGPHPRNNAITGANYPRQLPTAEEHFLERNPWANAQHSAHHQRPHVQSQAFSLPGADTPLSTPAAQKRMVDLNGPQGSASTIAEPQSGPSSSAIATPATGEQDSRVTHFVQGPVSDSPMLSTPSKPIASLANATISTSVAPDVIKLERIKGPPPEVKPPQLRPSLVTKEPPLRNQPKPDIIHKRLEPATGPETSTPPALRPSIGLRYPSVNADDPLHRSSQAAGMQYQHASISAKPTLNGQIDRVSA